MAVVGATLRMAFAVLPCHLKATAISRCLGAPVDMVVVTRIRALGAGVRIAPAASLATLLTTATVVIKVRLYRYHDVLPAAAVNADRNACVNVNFAITLKHDARTGVSSRALFWSRLLKKQEARTRSSCRALCQSFVSLVC